MNKKTVLLLVAILLLIYMIPKRSDHTRNALEALEIFSRISQGNLSPEKIPEAISDYEILAVCRI
jgi:hypothetical protein